MLPEGLLKDVKDRLKIYWDDANTDAEITSLIKQAMAFLNELAGTELDFSKDGNEKGMLVEYCDYARSKRLDEFIVNYAPFLSKLRDKNGGAYD